MKRAGLTAPAVEEKLRQLNGNMAAVARAFGCTRGAVWDFCRRRPTLQQVAQDVRESLKDHAESALYKAVLEGEAWAVCFYLKTQARDRGYGERMELAGDKDAPHTPIQIIEVTRCAERPAERNGDGD
jgi:hypothetical protein